MPAAANKLTDTAVRNAKPKEKVYTLADGGGMYQEVRPNCSRLWRLKYRIAGKEKLLALGAYPDVPLAKARELRSNARTLIADGTDPHRRQASQSTRAASHHGQCLRGAGPEMAF